MALIAIGSAAAGAALLALAALLFGLMPVASPPGLDAADLRALELSDPALGDATGATWGPWADEAGAESLDDAGIIVDVAGAVARPGLQRLPGGARIGDAIQAAGGYAPRVDLVEASRSLNLAQPLTDGGKVLVPELGDARPVADEPAGGLIDLNRADQAELETLPGIGPVTAAKIIDSRSSGPFGSVQELRDRGLVGESVFDQIRELVSVG